jgi:hypothetical protein
MAENYFNELSESYAKKNKLDLRIARKAVSKIIRNNFINPYQDKDLLDFDKSLFYIKDLDLVLDLRKKEKKKKNKKHFFAESANALFLEKFKDSLRTVKILSDLKYRIISYVVTKREATFLGSLLNTAKDVFNNLKIGKNTYIHVSADTSRNGKFIHTDSYTIKGTVSPEFLNKRKELVFTDIHGVKTVISKYVDSEGFAKCLYINNKNVNIFNGYIHIASGTHGKSIDEIKDLLKKKEDLKKASKVKRDFAKKLKELSSDLLVTRKDSLNAGNCSAGTDNFISRYLENKEIVKLNKLYEILKNKDLDLEIKNRLKSVISLKETQLNNTLNNLDNLVKI